MGEHENKNQTAASEPLAPRPTSVRWRIIVLLMAYSALNHFNRTSISVAGTEHIMKDYHIEPTRMGWVYTAFLLAYTLCMTPGGWVIDRWGARRALIGMGFGTAAFVFLTGLVGLQFRELTDATALFVSLLAVRALAGAFSAPIHPAAARVVSHWSPLASRSWANGLVNGAALLGIACTYTAFGFLMGKFGWQLPFLLAAAVTAAVALVWTWYATDRPAEHPTVNAAEKLLIGDAVAEARTEKPDAARRRSWVDSAPSLRALIGYDSVLNSRSLVALSLSYVAVGYFEFMLFYWMQYYFESLDFGPAETRYYSTACTLAMAGGMFAGGWLSDRCEGLLGYRRGRAAVPVAAMLGGALFLGLGVFSKAEPLRVVLYFALAMAAAGACEGPFWTTAIELGGRKGGTSAAIFNTAGNVGGFIAPVLTPYFSRFYGWEAGLGLAAVFCVLGSVLWWWVDPAERVSDLN